MTRLTPGLKTTEFWATVLALLLTSLVATGVLSPQQGQQLEAPLTRILTELAAILTDLVLVYRYISSRSELKLGSLMVAPDPEPKE